MLLRAFIRCALVALLVSGVNSSTSLAAPFSAEYYWDGPTSAAEGWQRRAVPDASWYSSSLGSGGLLVRPIKFGVPYDGDTRDGWQFSAPAGTYVLSARISGVDAAQDDRQRPRAYLAPHTGDDGEAVAPWGRQTTDDGDLLPSAFTLSPSPGETPTLVRLWLRTRECGGSQPPCAVVPAGSAARLNASRAVVTMDDPSPPEVNLAIAGAPPAPAWTNAATIEVSLRGRDGQSGVRRAVTSASGATLTGGSATWSRDLSGATLPQHPVDAEAPGTVLLPLQGTVTVSGSVENGAGVATAASSSLRVDRVPPPAPKFAKPFRPGAQISVADLHSGIASVDVRVAGTPATAPSCATGAKQCRFSVRAAAGQTVAIVVHDVAGNETGASAVVGTTQTSSAHTPSTVARDPKKPNRSPASRSPQSTRCAAGAVRCTSTDRGRRAPSAAPRVPSDTRTRPRADRQRTRASSGCAANALTLGAGGSFALGYVCANTQVVTRGIRFSAPCQIQKPLKKGGKKPYCPYQVMRIRAYAPEGQAKPASYCAIVPLTKNNTHPNPGAPGGGSVPLSGGGRENRSRRADCNKVILDRCKGTASERTNADVVGALRELVGKERDRISKVPGSPLTEPGYRGLDRDLAARGLLKSWRQLQPCSDAQKTKVRTNCDTKFPYLAAGAMGAMVNNEGGSASGALFHPDYVAREPSGLPVCTGVNPMPDQEPLTPTTNPYPAAGSKDRTSSCPFRIRWDFIDSDRGRVQLAWRYVTRDRRYVMAQVGHDLGNNKVIAYEGVPAGLTWFYVPIESVAGPLAEPERSGTPEIVRLADLCASSLDYLRSKRRNNHPFGFANAGRTGAKAGLWGNIVSCGAEPVGQKGTLK